MAQNLTEKIVQKFAVNCDYEIHSGDFITIKPNYVMTHDNSGAVINKFNAIKVKKVANPRQIVFALDHNVQDKSEKNLQKYAKIEAFAKKMGIDFYPAGRGIGHQIMCEEGYVWPGTMVVASDSHSNMYGGLGCIGTPIVRTDAAAIWATGQTWWHVPPVASVELRGKRRPGISGKDIIISLCGLFHNDEVLNHAIEFTGEGLEDLDVEQRLTIANMSTEWGALTGLFPIDDVTIQWLKSRINFVSKRGFAGVPSDIDGNGKHPRLQKVRIDKLIENKLAADADSFYVKKLHLDLDTVVPAVSGPNHVKVWNPVSKLEQENICINKAYLVSCVNARTSDFSAAARVAAGRKVAPNVSFYIAPASSEVHAEVVKNGDWQKLIDAGAIPLPAGCGPCIGLGAGLLMDGEVGISATNRNFKGRMGSPNAETYLASPAVVTYSAIKGKISSPIKYEFNEPHGNLIINKQNKAKKNTISLLTDFPEIIKGKIIFLNQDNINTDGIFPGKYTYIDDFTPEQQAEVVMENYDPEFGKIIEKGDILVSGFNFGTGSSREQAATALKYRGISMVIAGSFSETYKRNAINNGFLVIEAPELVKLLKERFGAEQLTLKTELTATINFKKCFISIDNQTIQIEPFGLTVQELIVAGNLEKWVANRL